MNQPTDQQAAPEEEASTRHRILEATAEVLSRAGTVEYRLCAGPSGVPIPAVMLAEKLMLEAQEAAFLQIAIKHPASPHAF